MLDGLHHDQDTERFRNLFFDDEDDDAEGLRRAKEEDGTDFDRAQSSSPRPYAHRHHVKSSSPQPPSPRSRNSNLTKRPSKDPPKRRDEKAVFYA
jgi:hypothetical protein